MKTEKTNTSKQTVTNREDDRPVGDRLLALIEENLKDNPRFAENDPDWFEKFMDDLQSKQDDQE